MSKSPMIAFIVVVLVILGAGAWLFMNNSKQATTSTAQNQSTTAEPSTMTSGTTDSTDSATQGLANAIEYTDAGFSPANLTVKVGDTVTWTNNSSKQMWVASAPHPTHTDYPGFDSKKGVGAGETYSFTFDKVGNWKFHDHLTPTKFGSVTVQ